MVVRSPSSQQPINKEIGSKYIIAFRLDLFQRLLNNEMVI